VAAPSPAAQEPAEPLAPRSAGTPASSPQVSPTQAFAAGRASEPGQDALLQGEHLLTLFFRGVLDAFLPEDADALRVVVDAASMAVPVEKILYFSHVLQRIILPTARPDHFARRTAKDCGPLPALTARLSKGTGDRHVLELYDNGHFFRARLPQIRLGLEAQQPLVAFVLANGGSVRLAQGRSVAFEITG